METPKEKALELIEKMDVVDFYIPRTALAIVCIEQMIEQNGELYLQGIAVDYYKKKNAFLFEVKKELEYNL